MKKAEKENTLEILKQSSKGAESLVVIDAEALARHLLNDDKFMGVFLDVLKKILQESIT